MDTARCLLFSVIAVIVSDSFSGKPPQPLILLRHFFCFALIFGLIAWQLPLKQYPEMDTSFFVHRNSTTASSSAGLKIWHTSSAARGRSWDQFSPAMSFLTRCTVLDKRFIKITAFETWWCFYWLNTILTSHHSMAETAPGAPHTKTPTSCMRSLCSIHA